MAENAELYPDTEASLTAVR